ncbi:MAG: PH domain-containing protein [Saprospiraceae bacterium]|nr:MAG: PH domain-containing protein [Saprospiraceae bacterium]
MAQYITTHLIKGEQVEYWAELHWIIFFTRKALLSLFLAPVIQRWTTEFAITNKRVVNKTGWIKRKTFEMNLSKIESVNVNQTILGRLLSYGDIIIIGTGGTKEEFKHIKRPIEFRKRFQELIF